MRRMSRPWILGLVVGLIATTAIAGEPTIEQMVRRCVNAIHGKKRETIDRIAHLCARTLEIIDERLAEGDREGAREAARAGAERVQAKTHRAMTAIIDGTRRCIHVLEREGATREQIRLVRDAAEGAIGAILRARDQCIAMIEDAIGGDGGGRGGRGGR